MSNKEIEQNTLSFMEFVWIYNQEFGFKLSFPQMRFCEWLDETHESNDRILMCYRESGKSHIIRLWVAYQLWRDPEFTVIVMSATRALASRNAAETRKIIENFSLTKHLVPPSNSGSWQTTNFTVVRPHGVGDASVYCLSAVSLNRSGWHAKYMLCDDVEVSTNVVSNEDREKLWNAITEFGSLANKRLYVGTPHAEESIYTKLQELDPSIEILKIPVWDEFEEPANPDVPINGCIQDREWILGKKKFGEGKFQSQYLLKNVQYEEPELRIDLVKQYKEEIQIIEGFNKEGRTKYYHRFDNKEIAKIIAYWDPADGTKGNDDSTLAICFRTKDGETYVHCVEEMPPIDVDGYEKQCHRVLDLMYKYFVTTIHIETNYNRTLPNELRKHAAKRRTYISVVEERRTTNKTTFISDTIGPVLANGEFNVHYKVWQGKLKGQMMAWPKVRHDDYIDSVAGCIDKLPFTYQSTGKNRMETAINASKPKVRVINPINSSFKRFW